MTEEEIKKNIHLDAVSLGIRVEKVVYQVNPYLFEQDLGCFVRGYLDFPQVLRILEEHGEDIKNVEDLFNWFYYHVKFPTEEMDLNFVDSMPNQFTFWIREYTSFPPYAHEERFTLNNMSFHFAYSYLLEYHDAPKLMKQTYQWLVDYFTQFLFLWNLERFTYYAFEQSQSMNQKKQDWIESTLFKNHLTEQLMVNYFSTQF